MFKKTFNSRWQPSAPRNPASQGRYLPFGIFFVFIMCLTGCQMFPTLPPVNLSEGGWTTRERQAVWRAKRAAPEIAGELVVSTNPDGRSFVQFTKTPLPFLAAQATSNSWQLHSIPNNKTYSGHGKPPVRAVWLWLPRCLAGVQPPKPLSWRRLEDNGWRLENISSGEFLEGYLTP